MANLEKTDIDTGSVIVEAGEFENGLVEFAATDIFAPGTLLARNTSNDKFQLYVKAGVSNGNGIVGAVLTYELERTGAGDVKARVLVSGKVTKERLIIDVDGDDSNIDGEVRDLCRQVSIIPVDVEQLGKFDN